MLSPFLLSSSSLSAPISDICSFATSIPPFLFIRFLHRHTLPPLLSLYSPPLPTLPPHIFSHAAAVLIHPKAQDVTALKPSQSAQPTTNAGSNTGSNADHDAGDIATMVLPTTFSVPGYQLGDVLGEGRHGENILFFLSFLLSFVPSFHVSSIGTSSTVLLEDAPSNECLDNLILQTRSVSIQKSQNGFNHSRFVFFGGVFFWMEEMEKRRRN